ncbi:MAG: peptide chain release factor N(5)-glutamine methyltransferase [Prolixibacteraceae bacterium]|jgi:release factor glutamine methyltransferase|nr:peptide chain release factor N(5)-glutamine methyltransferase [Prolixibacteraceae bacterium]HOY50776.1 peptide chain release factor N(5)-glutamine methyltransferase [Prolixibacteraceae bacterium]
MQATIQFLREELQGLYPETEIREFTRMILHALRGWTLTDMVLRGEELLTPGEATRTREIAARLKNREPIQYILGEVPFGELTLKVTPAVLIPRPETEELTAWIISTREAPPASLLDMGTGSGCIALALARAFPGCEAKGCDLSEEALAVARANALANPPGARFFKADILDWQNFAGWETTELIVSNPPYVTHSEKTEMEAHVLEYEPATALFVPDEDPLLYYRSIAAFARQWLSPAGELFLEINRRFGGEITSLLHGYGFHRVELRRDLSGNPRMVRAQR